MIKCPVCFCDVHINEWKLHIKKAHFGDENILIGKCLMGSCLNKDTKNARGMKLNRYFYHLEQYHGLIITRKRPFRTNQLNYSNNTNEIDDNNLISTADNNEDEFDGDFNIDNEEIESVIPEIDFLSINDYDPEKLLANIFIKHKCNSSLMQDIENVIKIIIMQSRDKVSSFVETNLLNKISPSKEDIKYVDLDPDEKISGFTTNDPILIEDEIKQIKEKRLYTVNVSKVVENFCIRNELNFDNGKIDIVLYMDEIQLRNPLKPSASFSYIMNISFKILHFKTIKSSKLTSICPFGFSISATTKMEKYKKLIATILKIIKNCKLTLNGVEHILNVKHVAGDNYMLGYFFQTDISFGSLSSNSCRLCKHHGNTWHLLNRISANDNEYLRVESTNPNLPLELSYTVDALHDIEEGLIAYANVVILNILVNIYGVNEYEIENYAIKYVKENKLTYIRKSITGIKIKNKISPLSNNKCIQRNKFSMSGAQQVSLLKTLISFIKKNRRLFCLSNSNIFIALLSFAESLKEIQVITSSHGLTDDDIHKLEENIDIYFNARPVLIHENYDITLKEHLILHYPEVFKKNQTDFTVFSSKRFESYNKVIKNLLATSVNYKNIPYSCAKRAMTLENCYNIIKPKI
ncbi:Hypothetical protein SRAE_0000050400 [Strongyloides ratti]|uniref:Uncharacterized protein n=1 Tax=Strongyloides ratti TaxID=34506 RepID=A0A090MSU0_STRRB|nr:Hypothetical protein SRAE_0000050400 [Strongyloides ratti]CEF61378.1 Hypothetical protein SRAE_0000050400 [Strongyloides ratti]